MPHVLHRHIQLHRLHYTEMNELYASLSLHAFASGLVAIFVPIYLYNLNFSITVIAVFFIIGNLTKCLIYRPTAAMAGRFGPKHVLLASYILTFIYTLLLFLLPERQWLLYPAALMHGLSAGVFWLSRHIDTASVISSERPTMEYSRLQILSLIAASSAPLFGGLIAAFFGIKYSLLGSGLVLLLAMYPLLKTLEPVLSANTLLPLFKTAPPKHLLANFAMNFQSIVAVLVWPLFIFLVVMSYEKVGIIASASLLLIVVVTWVSGKWGDRGKNAQILRVGSILRSGVHITRGFARSFTSALGVNVLGDVTDTLASVPYAVRYYESARRYGVAAYLIDMEVAGDIGKMIMWGLLIGFTLAFGLQTAMVLIFCLAAVLTPLLSLIEE